MYTINGITSDSFSVIAGLARSLPVIYQYIDSVYIYAENIGVVQTAGSSRPIELFEDNGWLDDYDDIASQRGMTVLRKKNNSYPARCV